MECPGVSGASRPSGGVGAHQRCAFAAVSVSQRQQGFFLKQKLFLFFFYCAGSCGQLAFEKERVFLFFIQTSVCYGLNTSANAWAH
jgi:hypothetical protein